MKKGRTELVELLHKLMRFPDIIELFFRGMLNDNLRKVLANMPLQPIRCGVTDLNSQTKSRVI
jgi:hypothetical protein